MKSRWRANMLPIFFFHTVKYSSQISRFNGLKRMPSPMQL